MQDAKDLQQNDSGESRVERSTMPTPEQLGAVLRGEDPASIAEGEANASRESEDAESNDLALISPETKTGEAGESPKEKAKPTTFDELAERAGVDVKDLHAVKINLGGDDGDNVMTLGELKDRVNVQENIAARELALESERSNAQAEAVKARADLVELVRMLPADAITPKFLERVRAGREAEIKQQRELTLSTIRDWQDEATEKNDRDAMREHLSRYGLPGEYIDSVIDHRMLAVLRDAMQLRQTVDKAMKNVRKVVHTGHGPAKHAAGKRPKKVSSRVVGRTTREAEQAAEVATLIRKG